MPAPRSFLRARNGHCWLSGGARDEGRHDVGGVPVEGHAGPVVAHRGARVGMTGRFLNVEQRDTRIESGRDERMPQRMRSDPLENPGPSSDASHDPGGAMTIETATAAVTENRAGAVFPDGEIDRPCGSWRERDRHRFAALAMNNECAVPALEAELFDVGTDRFGPAEPVQREQRDQGMIACSGHPAATSIAPTSLRSRPVALDS